MKQPASLPTANAAPRINRIATFQPEMSLEDLAEDVLHTEDPVVMRSVNNLVQVWASLHPELPDKFADQVKVVAVARQPVGIIVADTQHVRRSLIKVEEPFEGGVYDSAPWPSNDLFELAPVEPLEFAASTACQRFALSGNESVQRCGSCEGAGASVCQQCEGTKRVACSECQGTMQVPCSRCNGAGAHQGVSGRIVQCQLCHTRGTVRCTSCERGQVDCSQCTGKGQLTCGRCAGHGNLKSHWQLESQSSSHVHRRLVMKESWSVAAEPLAGDSDELHARVWPWPGTQALDRPLDEGLQADLAAPLQAAVERALAPQATLDPQEERVVGLRVRVLGTFCYRVEITYQGRPGCLLIAGAGNHVFVECLPTNKTGWLQKLQQKAQRTFSALDMTDRIGPMPEFVQGVHRGTTHISDSRCLVPAVSASLRAPARVTNDGYSLNLLSKDDTICFEIAIDVDATGQWVLRTMCDLGSSNRDRAPMALKTNSQLAFGRIALTSHGGNEKFCLIDYRFYDSLSIAHYSRILAAMAADIRQIRRRALLS